MTDLIPTQFDMPSSGAINETFNCEPATLAVGDVVHFTDLDTWDLASNASALLAGSKGLAQVVKATTAGNPCRVLVGQAVINLGTAIGVTVDEIVLSSTPGKMFPKADLLTGQIYTRLGYMQSPDELVWQPLRTGLVAP